jgi:hypothetical protein
MRNVFLLITVVFVSLTSCRFAGGKRIKGNGNVVTKEINRGDFDKVEQKGSFDIYLSNAPTASVKIEAEENLIEYIETYVDNNTLVIRTKKGISLRPGRDIKIFISAPHLTDIQSSGSGDIISQSLLSDTTKMSFGIRGSANIQVEVNAPEIDAEISGSGDMELKGTTRKFSAEVNGSGNIKALDLKSEDTDIEIKGSGDADVFASSSLNVNVRGSGDVRYKGNAQKVTNDIKGSGSVSKTD